MARCFWITGLSASGKTTLSRMLYEHYTHAGINTILLDGDELRDIFSNHSYTRVDRIKLGLSYSRLCKHLVSQNVNVIIAVIGLFKEIHHWNRKNIPEYCEIFIDTPIEELKKRDPKGIYKLYEEGETCNVAGLDLKVDYPENPDIHIKWAPKLDKENMFNLLLENLQKL